MPAFSYFSPRPTSYEFQFFLSHPCGLRTCRLEEGRGKQKHERLKKIWYIHAMEYYSAIKKNEILLFATTWMELEGILLSEISQRKILYNITYMWNLKNKTSEYDKKETYSQI